MALTRTNVSAAAKVSSASSAGRGGRMPASLDVAGFDPTGAGLEGLAGYDPLAPVGSPWSGPAAGAGSNAAVEHQEALLELADRAGVQLTALRGALAEAGRLEAAIDAKAVAIAHRLEQGIGFEKELDKRIAGAGRAGEVLDKAAAALAGLERVVAELRGVQVSVEASFKKELAAQEARVRAMLDDQAGRVERLLAGHAEAASRRIDEQREAVAARMTELGEQTQRAVDAAGAVAGAAEAEAARIGATIERNVRAVGDQLAAALDRQMAQVHARVGVLLDHSEQRVAELERRAECVGAGAEARVEAVCEKAAGLLGVHPLAGDEAADGATRGLAALVERAEAAGRAGDEAVVRLAVATQRAAEVEAKVAAAVAGAEAMKVDERLAREAAGVEERLAGLRDDLESLTSSVRFNMAEAQQVEAILGKTIDRARDKVGMLDRAMDQVTQQAGSLVQVARDVAGLVTRAEEAGRELAGAVERAPAVKAGAVGMAA